MRMSIQGTVFTYHEVLSDSLVLRLPSSLTLTRPSKEAILFRLLLGTINVSHNFDNITIKQRTNYSILGCKSVTRLNHLAVLDSQVPMRDFDIVNAYFMRNRVNTAFFEDLLSEFSNYFYQKSKKAYMSAFVHLYRAIEHLSYAFPLLYAKHSNSYKGTFNSMQSFFSNDSNSSELKMFQEFQKTLIADSVLKNDRCSINVLASTGDQSTKIANALMSLTNGLDVTLNGSQIQIYNKDLITFIIRLRNRFFHLLLGSERNNLQSKDIYTDLLFKCVNEEIANWIAYLYFEICKYGVSQ
ncbi:hypothetical protein [Paenibacillus sp. B2(2019)]|uniref:hypothetical protein n=1 Tax=Paenibacillus sp. B2(2019) TaxID=2607754 RepID=UPI0011F2369A|nr:hypothetical protein [Paenibacillus sp. B2(2019)]KAA1186168.1 hypothetical protein PAENI_15050 [Paenibacillus sp. B2(2019)]